MIKALNKIFLSIFFTSSPAGKGNILWAENGQGKIRGSKQYYYMKRYLELPYDIVGNIIHLDVQFSGGNQ